MKILSTYFDPFTHARHAVVVWPSTMPRQVGYTTHDASQALATTRNNNYTNVRVQKTLGKVTLLLMPRKQHVEAASGAYRGTRRRQGRGFASAIENFDSICKAQWRPVAWEMASLSRLKGVVSRKTTQVGVQQEASLKTFQDCMHMCNYLEQLERTQQHFERLHLF